MGASVVVRGQDIMKPKEVIAKWVEVINKGNIDSVLELYGDNAVSHHITEDPVVGKQHVLKMFEHEFGISDFVCIAENIFEDGQWAILEFKNTKGFRGSCFFQIKDSKIVFQRGYWDKLSFLEQKNA